MNHSFFFIINSRMGAARLREAETEIELQFSGKKYEVHKTEYGGHTTELAKEALAKNYTHVIAIGGDGTVNEVVRVLATSSVILGIVPCGSGNGLARHCGIPLDIPGAIGLILKGKAEWIDLGKVNDIYFISNAGVGLDAEVCYDIQHTKQRGLNMYIRFVAKKFLTYKPVNYTITTEQGKVIHDKGYMLNVANGRQFGYGFEIAPEASLQDGILDLILVKKLSVLSSIRFVMDGWRKKLTSNKDCFYIKGKSFTIESKEMKFLQSDGDAHECSGVCKFDVCEKALQLVVPHSMNHL